DPDTGNALRERSSAPSRVSRHGLFCTAIRADCIKIRTRSQAHTRAPPRVESDSSRMKTPRGTASMVTQVFGDKTQDKSSVQVIARAAAILRALENEASGLSLGQIAQRVGLARSTVQRIVAALEAEKLVIAASPTGRVRLGPTLLRLAASVHTDFASLARPFLMKLSGELR